MKVELIQRRVESWIRDQSSRISKLQLPEIKWVKVKWPPWSNDREHRMKLEQEYERTKKQIQELCRLVKAESVHDLQDILCSMVLSECVYKRPATELIQAVNKFKADFGGQIICLERVQPSLDHVPHRYLLAEAGDTLFASFVGTKQYKDVVADANILQGAIFHEDGMEEIEDADVGESVEVTNGQRSNLDTRSKTQKSKQLKPNLKPAAHRGFMARAKGIPALELYRLAQKKKRKLVLCGHSLGGAVAALATLAILRVIAVSSPFKENEKLQVKCITFSQPPVGNAALRDYVNREGWQHYFKTYCIPEDLVPRFLSPAYFHHYNAQSSLPLLDGGTATSVATTHGDSREKSSNGKLVENAGQKSKENDGEQLVLGVGPMQTPFWRLSHLVPLEGIRKHLIGQKEKSVSSKTSSMPDSSSSFPPANITTPASLEIEEDSNSVTLKPIVKSDEKAPDSDAFVRPPDRGSNNGGDGKAWGGVPYLPSYVPFGQLFLLRTSSVESLSDAEYSNLTSVKSVIAELKERLQSHSMKSYRSRFQRIYDLCTSDNTSPFLGIEQLQQFPHLQQWLGLSVAGAVELGHIVESPSIQTATSVVPLGWTGAPGAKDSDPLKVDISGSGLHLCTQVQAQVNGNWCTATVESLPSAPTFSSSDEQHKELHKMRVVIGAPFKSPPKNPIADPLLPVFSFIDSETINLKAQQILGSSSKNKFIHPPGLSTFVIYCTTDFSIVSKEVDVRTRRVRFVGMEGAGKTSLLKAVLHKGRRSTATDGENLQPEADFLEGIAGGLCYMDSSGINLQELSAEAMRLRDELWMGIRDLSKKIDLVVLVHNLAHQIPRYSDSNMPHRRPALSLLLDEVKALGIPWVLTITNKFSVSAHQQRAAIDAVLKAYQASPSNTGIVNSCPYVIHTAGQSYASLSSVGTLEDKDRGWDPQGFVLGPLNMVRRSFQRKATVLPVEGVDSFCQLVHHQLRSKDELSLEEFTRDRLSAALSRDGAKEGGGKGDAQDKATSISAATVGASLGAGLGVVLAVVMGAASALRKP